MRTDVSGAAFSVESTPAPKPVGPRTKKSAGAWARYRAYKQYIGLMANGLYAYPVTGPIELSVSFYLPYPKALTLAERRAASRGEYLPTGKPDLKNLIAAVEDSLTGIAWGDDSCVVSYGFAFKRYAVDSAPRTFILIRRLPAGLAGVHATTHDRGGLAAIMADCADRVDGEGKA